MYRRQLPRAVSDWALATYTGAEAMAVAGKAATEARVRRTKADVAREALGRPRAFGDSEQAQAGRRLARRRNVGGGT
jgi:hypothetical protein